MKFFISSLCFLLLSPLFAAKPFKIYYQGNEVYAQKVKITLMKHMKIPSELIEVKYMRNNCTEVKEGSVLAICMKNREKKIVDADREAINNAYKVFRRELR